jgi:hypothetical protein
MPDRITPKPVLPFWANYPELELALAEHLARYAQSLVGCGQMHEAREAIREAGAAQRRALNGAVDNTRSRASSAD